MADVAATATASIVPDTFAQDIAVLEAAIEGEAGVTSFVDPVAVGGSAEAPSDNVVSVQASASSAGTQAQWTVTMGTESGGTFAFAVQGLQTANLANPGGFDNAAIKANLEALPNVDEVTVTGTTTKTMVFSDPVRDVNLTFIDNLTGGAGSGIAETVAGVAPSSATAATQITDAIAAVGDCQLAPGSEVVQAGNPAITSSDGDNAITVAETATATVTYTTALVGARFVTLTATKEDGAALAATMFTFTHHGDRTGHASTLSAANQRQGQGTLAIHPPDESGSATTFKVVVRADDENGRMDYNVLIVTVPTD